MHHFFMHRLIYCGEEVSAEVFLSFSGFCASFLKKEELLKVKEKKKVNNYTILVMMSGASSSLRNGVDILLH